jgi:4-carboxymuconolactone decarboxylase
MTSGVPLPALTPDRLDAEQRRMYDAVLASPRAVGPGRKVLVREDGSLTGPFGAWLRSPTIGLLLERVGMALRTDAELSPAAREVAILVVAYAWKAEFEITVHTYAARAAGVPEALLARIEVGDVPGTGDIDDPLLLVWHLATQIQRDHSIEPALMQRGIRVLGERAVVEMVMNVGFYGLVSATLRAFPPDNDRTSA